MKAAAYGDEASLVSAAALQTRQGNSQKKIMIIQLAKADVPVADGATQMESERTSDDQ